MPKNLPELQETANTVGQPAEIYRFALIDAIGEITNAYEAIDMLWRTSFGGSDPTAGTTAEQCRARYGEIIDRARFTPR